MARFESELREHFSESWIAGYEGLIPRMTNHQEDRHVLAAAVHAAADAVVTLNLRHFPSGASESWGVRVLHPQTFLLELLGGNSAAVLATLSQQAADRRRPLPALLDILQTTVPAFVEEIRPAAK